MLTKNIVADDLAPFSYYKNTIPLYLQKDNGLLLQMQMLYNLFFNNFTDNKSSVTKAINFIFNSFNIFSINDDGTFSTVQGNREYLEFLDSIRDYFLLASQPSDWEDNYTSYYINVGTQENPEYVPIEGELPEWQPNTYYEINKNSKSLDLLAHFFGIGRNVTVSYLDPEQVPAVEVTEEITLTDDELLIYIKAMLIRNTFTGTYEKLIECYNMINLPIIALTEDNAAVYAEANVYLMLSSLDAVSANVKKLFLAGKLFIESMGIKYNYTIQDAQHVAVFDDSTEARTFDYGQFVL